MEQEVRIEVGEASDTLVEDSVGKSEHRLWGANSCFNPPVGENVLCMATLLRIIFKAM